jgi:hypothetical protein
MLQIYVLSTKKNSFSVTVVAFTIYNCMGTDWVRSKPIMGLVGLIVIILAACSSFGIVMYFHWEWQVFYNSP